VAEAKESEILRNRLDLLNTINPFVGTYFSREFVYDKILQLTEEEWDDMQTDITNDTELQQQLQAQQQAQQGQPPQGPADNNQQAQQDGPAPYDPNNPMVENTAIHNIMELRKFKL
jgi:hypothetical protein